MASDSEIRRKNTILLKAPVVNSELTPYHEAAMTTEVGKNLSLIFKWDKALILDQIAK